MSAHKLSLKLFLVLCVLGLICPATSWGGAYLNLSGDATAQNQTSAVQAAQATQAFEKARSAVLSCAGRRSSHALRRFALFSGLATAGVSVGAYSMEKAFYSRASLQHIKIIESLDQIKILFEELKLVEAVDLTSQLTIQFQKLGPIAKARKYIVATGGAIGGVMALTYLTALILPDDSLQQIKDVMRELFRRSFEVLTVSGAHSGEERIARYLNHPNLFIQEFLHLSPAQAQLLLAQSEPLQQMTIHFAEHTQPILEIYGDTLCK